MSKMCDDCLMIHCSYEPFSEFCQSVMEFNAEELQETIADKLAINHQREISSNMFAKQFISDWYINQINFVFYLQMKSRFY